MSCFVYRRNARENGGGAVQILACMITGCMDCIYAVISARDQVRDDPVRHHGRRVLRRREVGQQVSVLLTLSFLLFSDYFRILVHVRAI